MPVYFGTGAAVDINTVRQALSQSTGDVRTLASLSNLGTPDNFSDWWNVDFVSTVRLEQGQGFIWDGCSGSDTATFLQGTTEFGGFLNAFGGGSTNNSERGINNGTFLTFGFGFSVSRLRPYSLVAIGTEFYGPSACIPLAIDVFQVGCCTRARIDLPITPSIGYTQARYEFIVGFQQNLTFLGRLFVR